MKDTDRRTRGFTLVELVVGVLALGILAGISAATVPALMGHVREVRAQAMLKDIATAVLIYATEHEQSALTRESVTAAIEEHLLVDVVSGQSAANQTWVLGGKDFVPSGPLEFAVAFDDGTGQANDIAGATALLVTSTGQTSVARQVDWNTRTDTAVPADETIPAQPTPEDYVDNNPPDTAAPAPEPSTSPVTAPVTSADAKPVPSTPQPAPEPAPGGAGGGWVGYAVSDGWHVDVHGPAYAGTGPIVVTVTTPLTNQELTNERVRVEVVCVTGTAAARPVNSKDFTSRAGTVILEREFTCDRDGGFAQLSIAPSGRLEMATGTYYADGNPAYPY